MTRSQAFETQEELTGLLMLISIVSRRLAENIKKLDAGKEKKTDYAKPKPSS